MIFPEWLRGRRYAHGQDMALITTRQGTGIIFKDKCPIEDEWDYLPEDLQQDIINASLITGVVSIGGALAGVLTEVGRVKVWTDGDLSWGLKNGRVT